jgi:acyl-CoA thioester hydrolase
MGVVYHARYFEWFEAARTEMLRTSGLPYKDLEKKGILLPVIEAHCFYRRPVYYDELIDVYTELTSANRVRLNLNYEIKDESGRKPRIQGYTVHCYMNRDGKPIRASHELIDLFNRLMSK